MRVGVDATAFGNRHGDGRFARNAVRRLVELDGETRYHLLIDERAAASLELPSGAATVALPLARGASALTRRSVLDLARLGSAASRPRYDALLYPSLVSWFPAIGSPFVAGMHDTNVARFGSAVLPTRSARAAWRIKEAVVRRRASRLFTVSEAARSDLAAHLGIPREEMAVVPEAPDPIFGPRDPAATRSVLAPLGPLAADSFVLCAGGIHLHKDPGTLLAACATLRASGVNCPPLIVVGALDDGVANSAGPEIRRQIQREGLADHVLLPGFVDDETLACLYSASTVTVVTSHGEGFGLPAVEAARCGAPVVLSDISAHRESLGTAAQFFPPGDAGALARRLSKLLGSSAHRRELAERGRRAVDHLQWDGAAVALGTLLRETAGPPAGARDL